MLKKLLDRPVGVTMTMIVLLVVSVASIVRLPISLLPDVDIPQISIQVNLKGSTAREVNESVIQPLRSQLIQIPSLQMIRCNSFNNGGIIFMQFKHSTDIDFNFIEVNEKVNRALKYLPEGSERPKVVQTNATDIPAFFIDVTSKDSSVESFLELSQFSREVITKRIEQISQVAFVDVSGTLGSCLLVEPDMEKLSSLSIDVSDLENAIFSNNVDLGNLTIRDGHYQWNIRFDSEIQRPEDVDSIRLNIYDRIYLFKDLATVSLIPADAHGLVRSNGQRAVMMAVIKQSDAQMSVLKKELSKLMDSFEKEYPDISFTVTRNQTELLDYSIDNLKSNMLVGSILAVLVLLLFMKDFRSPILIAITIPFSLALSMLMLYLLDISLNVISLSGLLLGTGMMMDNSIIVVDNITQFWERGIPLKKAAVKAIKEVFGPMLSSVLTTCSVFVPLIFLSDIAGALFYDQAMAVTMTLLTSLLVSILVIPVYFCLLYGQQKKITQSRLLAWFQPVNYVSVYKKSLKWMLRHQRFAWTIFLAMMAVSGFLFFMLDKSKLPPITHDDIVIDIYWNSPISIAESDARITELMNGLDDVLQYDAMVGRQDFLFSHTSDVDPSQVKLYVKAVSSNGLNDVERDIIDRLMNRYPEATWSFSQSVNIFNKLFSDNEVDLVAMIRAEDGSVSDPDGLNTFIDSIRAELQELYLEPVVWQEQILLITDYEKMVLYGLDFSSIYEALSRVTKERILFSINYGSFSVPIIFGEETPKDILSIQVENGNGVAVPLSYVLKEHRIRDLKKVLSDKEGNYFPLNISADDANIKKIIKTIDRLAYENKTFNVTYSGTYFSSRGMLRELAVILLISIMLLFFILAAQFESLVQPFIILSEIFVDIFGALFALWICGAGINLMSLIGIVVMCGIVINDSILKVDTFNRYRRNGYSLIKAVMIGGTRRLKSIIMTSLTTIMAIVPFLVKGSMGSDLQFPLSVSLIGGVFLGTVVSILFLPLFYYEVYRESKKMRKSDLN